MTDKSTLLRAFNTHFFDFLEDIISITDSEEIKTSKITFMTIKKANPTAIIKVWNKHISTKYTDVIERGDIDFFFDKDYANDLTNVKNPDKVIGIIDSIRGPIRDMGDANKAHSVKYIQNLSKLSDRYAEISNSAVFSPALYA